MAIDSKNEVNKSENIILGSGDLYMMEFEGDIPEDAEVEKGEHQAGNIKGGASVEWSTSSNTVSDDMGRVKKTILTEEIVKFKTGLITWTTEWLKAIMSTTRVDEGTAGRRRIKIGGLANQNNKRYLFRFVHTKDNGQKIRLTITGKNVGAVTFSFQPDNPTQVDAEIQAEPLDGEGTLVIFDEETAEAGEGA